MVVIDSEFNDSEKLHNSELSLIDSFKKGELSSGKVSELLGVDKTELRKLLSSMNIPLINEDRCEAVEEAKKLLGSL